MIPVGSLHCSASDPAPCRWPVKTAEDGLSTWTSLPTWETQVRLLALAHPRSSRCSHLGSEPVDGRLNLFSLCLYFSLFISLSNKLREKKKHLLLHMLKNTELSLHQGSLGGQSSAGMRRHTWSSAWVCMQQQVQRGPGEMVMTPLPQATTCGPSGLFLLFVISSAIPVCCQENRISFLLLVLPCGWIAYSVVQFTCYYLYFILGSPYTLIDFSWVFFSLILQIMLLLCS